MSEHDGIHGTNGYREPTEAELRAERALLDELERQSKDGAIEFTPPVPDDPTVLIGGELDHMALVRAVIRSLLAAPPSPEMVDAWRKAAAGYDNPDRDEAWCSADFFAVIDAASPEIKS